MNSLIITLVAAFFVLNGCGATQSALSRGAPIEQGDPKAYVIVGIAGPESISAIETSHGLFQLNTSLNESEVFVFPIEKSRSFSMSQLHFAPKFRSEIKVASLRNQLFLPIRKPGIYYFGTIYTNRHGVHITSTPNAIMLRMAEEKHPQLFTAKKPVNF